MIEQQPGLWDEGRGHGGVCPGRPPASAVPLTPPLVPSTARAELAGTGVDLAVGLGALAAELDGPELTTVGERARGHLVDVAVAAERVQAWAAAVQAKAVAALTAQFLAEGDLDDAELSERARSSARSRGPGAELAAFDLAARATSACLSLALGVSSRAADRLVALALGLDELPDLAEALTLGRVDVAQARVIHETTTGLDPRTRAEVVASVVTDPAAVAALVDPPAEPSSTPAEPSSTQAEPSSTQAEPSSPRLVRELADGTVPVWAVPAHKLRPILAREIAAAAPETVESAEVVLERGRRVAYYPTTPERAGALVLHGPDAQLAAVYDHLDTTARAARRAGAPQSLDQLRYDHAITALTADQTGPGRRPRVGIDIVVAADTLLGLDQAPAALRTPAGDVPISAAQARRLAADHDARWRRILTDPTTGTATDVSAYYRPTKPIADYVTVRDAHTSRHPTSGARHLELDHIREYNHADPDAGGPTTPANLAAVGKRDHQTKTDRLITVTGDANTTLTYRTPDGHTYPSHPHRYTQPTAADPPY